MNITAHCLAPDDPQGLYSDYDNGTRVVLMVSVRNRMVVRLCNLFEKCNPGIYIFRIVTLAEPMVHNKDYLLQSVYS